MDKILELTHQLKDELDSLPLFQEFERVKTLIETNEELNDLKKEIALAKLHNDNEYHSKLLEKYNSHPLILNFEALKKDVYQYLKEISEIINKK